DPKTQWFGSGCGQNGLTSRRGACATGAAASATTSAPHTHRGRFIEAPQNVRGLSNENESGERAKGRGQGKSAKGPRRRLRARCPQLLPPALCPSALTLDRLVRTRLGGPDGALVHLGDGRETLVHKLLHTLTAVRLGGVEVALRIGRDAVHGVELAGLAAAV